MVRLTTKYLLTILLISFISCKNKKDVLEQPPPTSLHASAGSCVVKAEMFQPLNKLDKDSSVSCGKTPCYARIKIISVIERGGNFGQEITSGSVIEAKFAFGLKKTDKNLFPNLKKTYPGLQVGDKFSAILEARLQLNKEKPLYYISDYHLN